MKTISLILLAFLFAVFSACETKEIEAYHSMDDLTASLKPSQKIAWMLDIPSGSKITHDNGNVHIQFPEHVTAYCYNPSTGIWVENNSLDYNCNCQSGNQKCTPVSAKGQVGCVTDIENPCSDCRGTVKDDTDKGTDPRMYSKIIYQQNASKSLIPLMALDYHIMPALSLSDLQQYRQATEEDINNPVIMNDFLEFIDNLKEQYANADFSDNQIPEGFGIVPFIISTQMKSKNPSDFSVAYVLVPKNDIKDGMMEITQVRYFSGTSNFEHSDHSSRSKVSCSGNCSTGSCTLKSYAGGILKSCEGCDSGCTIHIE